MASDGDMPPFRFFDLPIEIRNRVYDFVFLPMYEFRGQHLLGRIGGPNLQILRANKQTFDEAWKELYVAWGATTIQIPEASILVRLKKALPEPLKITHLRLAFSQKGFLIFFGGKIGTELSRDKKPRALVLRELPLETLELEMPHPKRMGGSFLSGGCNDVVTGWICRFAIPFVKHVPIVDMVGCIKNRRKAEFEQMLVKAVQATKLPVPTWQQRPDYFDRVMISIDDKDLPPVCLCHYPCVVDGEFNVEE